MCDFWAHPQRKNNHMNISNLLSPMSSQRPPSTSTDYSFLFLNPTFLAEEAQNLSWYYMTSKTIWGSPYSQRSETLPEFSLHGTERATRRTTVFPLLFFLPLPHSRPTSWCLPLLFFTRTSNSHLRTLTVNVSDHLGAEWALLSPVRISPCPD